MLLIDPFFLLYFFPWFWSAYYFVLRNTQIANVAIVIASIYFYSTFGFWQLPILIIPLIADYFLGIFISKSKNSFYSKLYLFVGISLNVVLLGYFKYTNFFLGTFGLQNYLKDIVLPVGISFIVFQRISYLVDIYRRKFSPEKNFINYAAYASLFPHLISGPIVRYSQIKDELKSRVLNSSTIFEGTKIFVIGFAYKILIADQLFVLEDYLINRSGLNSIESLATILYFSFRIYFDFLGYSLMAVGVAKLLGFTFPYNFNAPYQARSITDFWRRWNITLSFWIRDYLYIPLGGNRKGRLRTYSNLIVVMLIAGLWHGASWNFVAWGALHGIYLAIERYSGNRRFVIHIPDNLKIAFTFTLVTFGWILFRFTNMRDIQQMLGNIFSMDISPFSSVTQNIFLYTVPSLLAAFVISFFVKEEYLHKITPKIVHIIPLLILFLISLCFAVLKVDTFFIYNQF